MPCPKQDCNFGLVELLVWFPYHWGHHLTDSVPLKGAPFSGGRKGAGSPPALPWWRDHTGWGVGSGECWTRMLCPYQKSQSSMTGYISVCFMSLANFQNTDMVVIDNFAQLCCCFWGGGCVSLLTSFWWCYVIFVTLSTLPERGRSCLGWGVALRGSL